MAFHNFTTCPLCGSHTPMIMRKQDGKNVRETTACPVHGIILWDVRGEIRKLVGFTQKVAAKRLSPVGSFMDRCDRWSELRFQGCNSRMIRRIPPKKRGL
jgi:hypothetical protein